MALSLRRAFTERDKVCLKNQKHYLDRNLHLYLLYSKVLTPLTTQVSRLSIHSFLSKLCINGPPPPPAPGIPQCRDTQTALPVANARPGRTPGRRRAGRGSPQHGSRPGGPGQHRHTTQPPPLPENPGEAGPLSLPSAAPPPLRGPGRASSRRWRGRQLTLTPQGHWGAPCSAASRRPRGRRRPGGAHRRRAAGRRVEEGRILGGGLPGAHSSRRGWGPGRAPSCRQRCTVRASCGQAMKRRSSTLARCT